MSFSNNFDVDFTFGSKASGLTERFKSYGITANVGSFTNPKEPNASDPSFILKTFCDEAQLPNIQAATGQINGRILGQNNVYYPHSKMYSDFQLSWMCDANMIPLKFLNIWYGWIFQDFNYATGGGELNARNERNKTLKDLKSGAGSSGGNSIFADASVRLSYPETFYSNIIVTKTEKGVNASNGRASISYTMINAYPYSIDAVPLSYGASQVTKVTANFYYTRHAVVYNDIRNFDG